jgi:hypothetical protein
MQLPDHLRDKVDKLLDRAQFICAKGYSLQVSCRDDMVNPSLIHLETQSVIYATVIKFGNVEAHRMYDLEQKFKADYELAFVTGKPVSSSLEPKGPMCLPFPRSRKLEKEKTPEPVIPLEVVPPPKEEIPLSQEKHLVTQVKEYCFLEQMCSEEASALLGAIKAVRKQYKALFNWKPIMLDYRLGMNNDKWITILAGWLLRNDMKLTKEIYVHIISYYGYSVDLNTTDMSMIKAYQQVLKIELFMANKERYSAFNTFNYKVKENLRLGYQSFLT